MLVASAADLTYERPGTCMRVVVVQKCLFGNEALQAQRTLKELNTEVSELDVSFEVELGAEGLAAVFQVTVVSAEFITINLLHL